MSGRLTIVAAGLLLTANAIGQRQAGDAFRLEFPDLPPTFEAMARNIEGAVPSVTVRLPDDYDPKGRFPLFVHLAGGYGGAGANLSVPLQVTRGKGWVVANFPLFKRLRPVRGKSWTIAIGADDAALLGRAFAAFIAKIKAEVPNLDFDRSVLGGHSNGANATAALLSLLDAGTLESFGGFYLLDGGHDWSSYKRTEVLGNHHILLLTGGGRPDVDEPWRPRLLARADHLRKASEHTKTTRWHFETVPGAGHEIANAHRERLREWIAQVNRR